jgi:transcriptional regulator with XRE-family HTH domain
MEIRKNQLGCLIKTARLDAHLTQNQLAEKLGITSRHLMSIENDKKKPSYDLLLRIVRELQISGDSIFYPEREYGDPAINKMKRLLSKRFDDQSVREIIEALQSVLDKSQCNCDKCFR